MDEITKPIEKYYKIQKFDKNSISWIDKQVRYDSLKEAQKVLPTSIKARIMVIEGKKRYPLNA